MRDLPIPWTEIIPPGSVQSSTQSYGADFGSRVMTIKIAWHLLFNAIHHIVGWSATVQPGTTLARAAAGIQGNGYFDTNNPAAQGPYILLRKNPARHPAMPNLRATKIVSVQGKGLRNDVGGPRGGKVACGQGFYGNWENAEVSILFEIPKYPIVDEEEMPVKAGSVVIGRQPEYIRNVEWSFDTNVETLARDGVTWTYALPAAYAQQQSFNGKALLRQAKGVLKAKWYDVHQDFTVLGRLIPVNFFKRNSTVNARAFPQAAYRDQNVALAAAAPFVRFKPGALLLMPMKSQPHAQCHPAVLQGQINPWYFPRTLDMEISWIVFDPDTNDTTVVDLSAASYGANPPAEGGQFTTGGTVATTLVRGHNLAPLVKPLSGFRFFAVRDNAAGVVTAASDRDAGSLIRITSAAHGLTTGDVISLDALFYSVGGTLAQNWTITRITADTFDLQGSAGPVFGTYPRGATLATWRSLSPVLTEANLLHQYTDHEKLFAGVESL